MLIVKNIEMQNFKRIENLSVDLKSFDCLVGSNNSGKTTLLQALALFGFCVRSCLSKKNGGSLEVKRRTFGQDEFYVIPVADPNNLWTDRRTVGSNQKHIIIQIKVTFASEQYVVANVDLNFNRLAVSIQPSEESQDFLKALVELKISYLPVFSTFLPQEERRTQAVIADELARGRVNSIIRNLLLDLKSEKHDQALVDVLKRNFTELSDMRIEFDEVNDRYINVVYKENDRKREFDIFSAGSGFQQFIYLFGFIFLQEPTIILLDEPDVHLHGGLQRALLRELQVLVESGKQIIFATHSRELINGMRPENILTLDGHQAHRLKVAFDIYDTLDRLGSLEITQLSVIQAYRSVLLVENKIDWDLISIFCSKILAPETWQQIERRLAICFSFGNPYKQGAVERLRKQFEQTLSLEGKPLKLYVVSDSDYYPDIPKLKTTLRQEHITWQIWQRAEVENYLLVLPAIQRLLKLQEPLLLQLIQQDFDQALQDTYDTVNDKLVNGFAEFSRSEKLGWDSATFSRKAREYLRDHWEQNKLALADAKDSVLPTMKRWAQEQRLGQFSDKALANEIRAEELPAEIHEFAQSLARFVGLN